MSNSVNPKTKDFYKSPIQETPFKKYQKPEKPLDFCPINDVFWKISKFQKRVNINGLFDGVS